jgi:hypothetical protein
VGTSQEWQIDINYSPACNTAWAALVLAHGSGTCYQCTLNFYRINPYCAIDGVNHNDVSGTLYSGAWTNQYYLPDGTNTGGWATQGTLKEYPARRHRIGGSISIPTLLPITKSTPTLRGA